MYNKFFGFHQKPFAVTPDPAFFYPGVSHREGLSNLRYGIREKMGFVVLTGEVGIGKTFLVRSLLQDVGDDVRRALILNPVLDPDELFKSILNDLEVPYDKEGGVVERLAAFNEFLLEEHERGTTVVVIVDESQNLPADSLERLRLLSNLETATAKLLQIVLVGQPELDNVLALPSMRQLTQRIAVRHKLVPFKSSETSEYILHRLKVAGGNADRVRFAPSACRLIHRASGGVPRLIGLMCDYGLLIAFTDGKRLVTKAMAREAIRKFQRTEPLGGSFSNSMARAFRRAWKPLAAGATGMALLLGLSALDLGPEWKRVSSGLNEKVRSAFSATVGSESAVPSEVGEEKASPSHENVNAWNFDEIEAEAPVAKESVATLEPLGPSPAAPIERFSVEANTPESTTEPEAPQPEERTASFPVVEISKEDKERTKSKSNPETVSETSSEPVKEVMKIESVESVESVEVVETRVPVSEDSLREPSETLAPEEPAFEELPEIDEPDLDLRYGIQVASFRSIERSRRMADQIKEYGPVFLVPSTGRGSYEWIRVVLGVYETKRQGEIQLGGFEGEKWAHDARIVENRWWQQIPGATGGDVFAMAGE